MSLKTVRDGRPPYQPPSLPNYPSYVSFCDFVEEVGRCALYSLALLKDLPALDSLKVQEPETSEPLVQQYQEACIAVRRYCKNIFEPTARRTSICLDRDEDIGCRERMEKAHRYLQQQIDGLDHWLDEAWERGKWETSDYKVMSSRTPWVRKFPSDREAKLSSCDRRSSLRVSR